MRITLVTETCLPQNNEVSRTLGELVRVLEGHGDTVQLVAPDCGAPLRREQDHPARSLRVPFFRDLRLPLPPFGRARRALDSFRPDLVHVATEGPLGLAMLLHARRRGWRVVSSLHLDFDRTLRRWRLGIASGTVWRYLRWFHNATLETCAPSRAAIESLRARGFRRLVPLPRGVDSGLFRPDRPGRELVRSALGIRPEEVVVGCVGRMAAGKNLPWLAESLRELLRLRPATRILFVGDGPERVRVEERLRGVALFAGHRTGEDLADHYAAMDLFAFASCTETAGNVLLEAMSSGLPVVALRAGGPASVVREGETGYLFEPEVPARDFAERLARLAGDAVLRKRLAGNARAWALTQGWDAILDGLRERYCAIVEGRAVSPGAPAPSS